ncbi:hypothetical protein OEW28_14895 [Defluviimonas sp. WL0002]|uniref:Alpha/beta hydrolase n=1 Tax=Albidovulum marisflavi TaxID=2984159 RepID=A0ABT2ZFN8_9RHOB|nr:hypothetical protein [Defluviimonas sp. WL0002]MCV2869916.1 hypothetical protein [Defluviimonas sp. WL0002]
MQSGRDRAVRLRRVFYIPGYDPFPPRRYRELYRSEGAAQARVSGYALDVRGLPGQSNRWQARFAESGAESMAELEVLLWDDIVRGSMSRSIPATYVQALRTAWVYLSGGAFFRLLRLRKGPMIAALYPVALLLLQAAVAGLAAVGANLAVLHLLADWAFPWAQAFAALPAVAVFAGTLVVFRHWDNRVFAYYLMHDYAFSALGRGAYSSSLEHRLRTFQARLAEALRDEATQEVLVVGHSSGAHLAVSVLADLIREGKVPAGGPALSLLTLGHVVPMVAVLPEAARLRRDLRYLSKRDELTWVDVTAPGDGCTFALCDPVAVVGVAEPGKLWPLVLSAAFTQTLSADRWRALRWRFFRLHFQYLCAFDRPGDYDYFRITAGPLTLAARFAGRAASQSRIERAIVRFRDAA